MSWILEHKEWIFSGAGTVLIGSILAFLLKRRDGAAEANQNSVISNNPNVVGSNQVVNVYAAERGAVSSGVSGFNQVEPRKVKDSTRILFIDDDVKFKVVKILRNAGWKNATLVKDVGSLNDQVLVDADIVFVDIQGVGLLCGFKDEGLGLAAAIKERYPNKKLIIYSAEPRGAIFHEALKKADFSLEKNADPYEFERLVEQFSGL